MRGKRRGLSRALRSQGPKGGEASDAVSALIVALDMMFKRTSKDRATDVDSAPCSMTLTTGHTYFLPCFCCQDSTSATASFSFMSDIECSKSFPLRKAEVQESNQAQ